jgi:N-acyl-D-amino-acid deacylase
VPGTFAAEQELFGIGAALGELGTGVFELAPAGSAGEDVDDPKKEMDWMRRLSAHVGRPVTFAMLQVDPYPDLWADLLAESLAATAEGADVWPQVAGRPTGLLSGHQTSYSLLDQIPAYVELKARGLSPAALAQELGDPEVRRRVVTWQPPDEATAVAMEKAYHHTYLLGSPPDYEPDRERSLAAVAARTGQTPLEVAYDAMMEGEGSGHLYVPILNYSSGSLDPTRTMLLHPRAALGLGDGGAHVGIICDASTPTYMLTHWARDRSRGPGLPIELVVQKQTRETARLYGMTDRGTLEPGMLADCNLVDFERLQLGDPWVSADLPAGGTRLLQGAEGYVATIKRGVITFEEGRDTGARPGHLVRGAS